jgi:hypothetical protein
MAQCLALTCAAHADWPAPELAERRQFRPKMDA